MKKADGEDEAPNKKKKAIKNDLLTGKRDEFSDAKKTVEILKKHGFSTKTVRGVRGLNAQLREDLNINDLEYLVFCIVLARQEKTSVHAIMNAVQETSLRALVQILSVMFELYKKDIFSLVPETGDVNFRISFRVFDYLYARKEFKPETEKNFKKILSEMDAIANLYNAPPVMAKLGEKYILTIIDEYAPKFELFELLKNISVKSVESGKDDYKFLFYLLCHLILNNYDTPSLEKNSSLIDMFVEADNEREGIINRLFTDDKHLFFVEKIFDRAIDESGKADKNAIELHADFKRKYVKEFIRERRHEDTIKSSKIVKKELFFNSSNKEKIDELTEMLAAKNFSSIRKRLSKAGTRTGFIILFFGMPGTGKTEEAFQLAKKTGRDIIKVDMSSIRSKWWGEDEKNVKGIFNNYRAVLQDSRIEPILLLNEADALIGKRLDVSGDNGALISSINATQNIILDAFDEFEGILIATTNLTKNFDTAFERRFLYRIEFEKPNIDTRMAIIEYMLKIPKEDAIAIAKDFELSGANIENIKRKMTTRNILYGEEYNFDRLLSYCKDEKIEKNKAIGFSN